MRHKKREQIDPKTLTKSSSIRKRYGSNLVIAGDRIATPYGYRVAGVTSTDFETFFEEVAASQYTPLWLHEHKTRVYRILEGRGQAVLRKGDEERTVNLVRGDELAMTPGIAYRLASDGVDSLKLSVTQSSLYEDDLQELAPGSDLNHPESMLKSIVKPDREVMPRVRSKAAQQIAAQRAARGRVERVAAERPSAYVEEGVNLRPGRGLRELIANAG
jgi:mannose-6-phosphate isomerase-like protein (cupin superfamily)